MNRATRALLTLTIGLVSLGLTTGASADNISDLQNQLKSVMQRINDLKGQLGAVDGPTGSGSCPNLSRTLRKGMRGNDVKALQAFLAGDPNIYPEGTVGGYYGPATERAVQRFQERNGIVAYGDPFTTGYGVVGGKSRSVIASLCGGGDTGVPRGLNSSANVSQFEFTTSSGNAPYTAVLKFQLIDALCTSYDIDWGDGTDHAKYESQSQNNCGTGLTDRTISHEFKTAGTYAVTLRAQKGNSANMPVVMKRTMTIAKGEPYVTMITPNAGTAIRLGEYAKIKWDTGNYPADSAIAFYMVGPYQTYSFAKRSMRTSEFDWIVGDRVCDGNSCEVQMPAGQYKVRAVMYTPADGCIDFCTSDDTPAKTVITSESGYFTVNSLGTTGGSPITISGSKGIAPYTISVHAELAPTSTASNFEIDFGDGTQKYTIHVPAGEARATVRDVAHTYTKTGTYSVAIRPAGAVQNIGVAMLTVEAPQFKVLPKEGAYAPATVKATFDVDTSCVPQGTSASSRRYTVDWGDNTETDVHEVTPQPCPSVVPGPQTITQKTFSHPYADSGSRSVKLNVNNGSYSYNAASTINLSSTQFGVSPSFFTKGPYNVTGSFKIDQSCSAAGGATATYTIDWGDSTAPSVRSVTLGACSASFSPSIADATMTHTYATNGTYTATLTVARTDVPGGTITKTKQIVADTEATSYIWRALQALLTGNTESLTANANGAASSFYVWASGK